MTTFNELTSYEDHKPSNTSPQLLLTCDLKPPASNRPGSIIRSLACTETLSNSIQCLLYQSVCSMCESKYTTKHVQHTFHVVERAHVMTYVCTGSTTDLVDLTSLTASYLLLSGYQVDTLLVSYCRPNFC